TWIECHHCETRLTLPPAGPGRVTTGEAALQPGAPPAGRERRERVVRLLAVVVLLAVVAVVVMVATRGLRHPHAAVAAKPAPGTAVASLVVVRPLTATASSESGERVARNVIDRNLTTYWSRHVPGTDAQPFLQFTFATPVKLTELQIAAGASGDQFIARPRPQRIALLFADGSSLNFSLADKRGFQKISFPPRSVGKFRLVILSIYPGTDLPRTSISEVKFLAAP
ncbi:MAG TPA: discoidin domain-containing protein, partial [Actinomycetota bacterium]